MTDILGIGVRLMVYKQVIAVRTDLEMSPGKIASQCSHASVSALDSANKKILAAWKKEGQKKVVVQARNEKELFELKAKCGKHKISCSLVIDAGLTDLIPGTATALAIGPEKEEKINKITGSLPLLK